MRQEETIRREILEQRIDRELEALSEKLFGKKLEDASDEQVYVALLYLVKGLEVVTVVWDVWLPALWIPLQPWVFPAKASA